MAIELPGPVAYVFTGGASNGAAQAGMLQAVEETNLELDLITGTSVGALNGAVAAEQPEDAGARLAEIWAGLETRHVFVDGIIMRLRNLVGTRRYMYSGRGLRRLIDKHVSADRIEDLRLPLGVVATEVISGHAALLRRGALVEAVAASAALPGILPNVTIDDTLLMDGGVVANAPVHAAVEMGARSIVLFDAGYACHLMEAPRHAASRILHAMSVLVRRQMERDVTEVAQTVPVLALPPLCPMRTSPLDFSNSSGLIEEGFETSRRFLREVVVHGPGIIGELHRHDGPVSRY